MSRRKREPEKPALSLYGEILATCKARYPEIEWDLIERELNGGIVYKLTGKRGEIATFAPLDGTAKAYEIKANAEAAACIVAERIARIAKKAA